jgi:hypothetical protein
VDAVVAELLELPGLEPCIQTEIYLRLLQLSSAHARGKTTLGVSTTSLSDSTNKLLQQRSGGPAQTLLAIRNIGLCVFNLAVPNWQDRASRMRLPADEQVRGGGQRLTRPDSAQADCPRTGI